MAIIRLCSRSIGGGNLLFITEKLYSAFFCSKKRLSTFISESNFSGPRLNPELRENFVKKIKLLNKRTKAYEATIFFARLRFTP